MLVILILVLAGLAPGIVTAWQVYQRHGWPRALAAGAGVTIATIQQAAERVGREARALINIRPFTGDRLLAHDPWAMDALFAEQLLALVDEGPDTVVELGSGHSTILIARRLEAIGRWISALPQ